MTMDLTRARRSLVASEAHVAAFKAIAHIARLRIFFFLVSARREVATGEIQEAIGIPAPTLSHHLDVLRRAGLVQSRREARFIYCSVDYELVSDLVGLLSACC
jgi:ArsR family transcriptional regulator, arsenate/arsenite/antimonite-responsive transcriptional repressor